MNDLDYNNFSIDELAMVIKLDKEKIQILANKFDLSIPNLIKDILNQYLKKHLTENI